MDTDSGHFVEEESTDRWMQRLAIGETVKIKGKELRVVVIEGRRVTLELKSAEERLREELDAGDALREMRSRAIHGTRFVGGTASRKQDGGRKDGR